MAVVTLVKAPGQAGSMFILGHGDMVFSFFSTVSYHLEGPGNWGKIFPRLLLDLCDHGLVENKYLDELSKELVIVSQGLKKFPISSAVYDINDVSVPVPWDIISGEENNNLAQPWVTPRGEISYFDVFFNNIQKAKSEKTSLLLIYPPEMADIKSLWSPKKKGREYWMKDKSC